MQDFSFVDVRLKPEAIRLILHFDTEMPLNFGRLEVQSRSAAAPGYEAGIDEIAFRLAISERLPVLRDDDPARRV
jgi:hypothetical protein